MALPRLVPLVAILMAASGVARAEDSTWFDDTALDFSVEIGAEVRVFPREPAYPGQFSGVQPSVFIEPELFWESDDREHQVKFIPYARFDARDDDRSLVDVREAYWLYLAEEFELLVGVNRVFWGVTESRHLVNIINQHDQALNQTEEEFLGQPMVNLSLQRDYGLFQAYVLPGFRERTFPGREGRERGPAPVDTDAATYDSGAEEAHVDFAGRYSHYFGDWDVGIGVFHGTSREPVLTLDAANQRFIPHYDQITQIGLDLQYTDDAWLWKLEAIGRSGQGDTFHAFVAGFEYTMFQVADTDADLGFLAEALVDRRDQTAAPATPLENDVFLGTRLALNDVQDTSVLSGVIVDWEDGSVSALVEAQRRLGESWRAEVEARAGVALDDANLAASQKDDMQALFRLTYFY